MSDSSDSGNSSSSSNDGGSTSTSSWWSQAKDQYDFYMDQSRIERLQQCRVLQDTLKACKKAAKKQKNQPPQSGEIQPRLHLENSSSGVRLLNFFKWRALHDFDATCQREEHAVWACRAVALQCGGELNELRRCFFDAQGGFDPQTGEPLNPGAVLDHPRTAYEIGKLSNKKAKKLEDHEIPCRHVQERMGECIAENSKALARRHLERTGTPATGESAGQ